MAHHNSHTSKSTVQQAVTDLYWSDLEAWNCGDAKAMATLFEPDGSVVGFDGSQVDGREAIASGMGAICAHHKTASYVGIVREVRQLSPEVAVLRAVAGMVPPGGAGIMTAVNAVQTLVAVRRDGAWQVAVYQNTPAAFHGRPELSQSLTEELRAELRVLPMGRAVR
jgi:uncharacterized protein (TIGR02246 family)